MPSPLQPLDLAGGQVVLTSYYIGYDSEQGFVADIVAPAVPVDVMDGNILVEDFGSSRRRERMNRMVGGKFHRSGPALGAKEYHCSEEGHEVPLDDLIVRNNPGQIAIDQIHSRRAGDLCAREREFKVATKARATANHFSAAHYDTLSGPDLWSDYDNSEPNVAVKDILVAIHHDSNVPSSKIKMLIPQNVYEMLRLHPHVNRAIQYTMRATPDNITPQLLAGYFGVGQVVVAGGIVNNAKEGLADDIAEIWGNDVLLFYSSPNPLSNKTTANFMVTASLYGTTIIQIESYRDETIKSDVYRGSYCTE